MKENGMIRSTARGGMQQQLPNGICIYRGSYESRHLSPKIVGLLKKHLAQGDDLRFRDIDELYDAFDEKRCVYALDRYGSIIGFVFFSVYEAQDYGKRSFVSNSSLIMENSLRGYGVGKMMKQMLHRIADENYPEHDVISLSSNPIVFHLNKRMGFIEITNYDLWRIYGFDMIRECENRPNLVCNIHRSPFSHDPFENTKIFHAQTGRSIKNMIYIRWDNWI